MKDITLIMLCLIAGAIGCYLFKLELDKELLVYEQQNQCIKQKIQLEHERNTVKRVGTSCDLKEKSNEQ